MTHLGRPERTTPNTTPNPPTSLRKRSLPCAESTRRGLHRSYPQPNRTQGPSFPALRSVGPTRPRPLAFRVEALDGPTLPRAPATRPFRQLGRDPCVEPPEGRLERRRAVSANGPPAGTTSDFPFQPVSTHRSPRRRLATWAGPAALIGPAAPLWTEFQEKSVWETLGVALPLFSSAPSSSTHRKRSLPLPKALSIFI